MKTLIAAVGALALAGAGAASAQTSVDANANVKAGKTHAGAKAGARTSAKKHRSTTGAGVSTGIETRDNNASARGSLLPGKDRLNSESFIKDRQ